MAFGDINSGTTIELTQDQLNVIIKQTLLAAHPVGSIYQSLDSTSPADLFGGTWEKLENRFLLAAYDGCTAGSVGGEATHTLTVNETPVHGHTVRIWNNAGTTAAAKNWISNGATQSTQDSGIQFRDATVDSHNLFTWTSNPIAAQSGNGDQAGRTDSAGGGAAHNNMPPYIAVWTWKRTA